MKPINTKTKPLEKACSKCKEVKPYEQFNIDNNPNCLSGRTSWCKQCLANRRKENKANFETNKLKKTHKICYTCKVKKTIDNFYEDSTSADGHQSNCKPCKAIADKKTKRNNVLNFEANRSKQTTKECNQCKKTFPIEDFYPKKSSSDGSSHICKYCERKNNRENNKNVGSNYNIYQMHKGAKNRAEEANREFLITKEDIAEELEKNWCENKQQYDLLVPAGVEDSYEGEGYYCPITGWKFKTGKGAKVPTSPSVDRLVNETGYNKRNIWIICSAANSAKATSNPYTLRFMADVIQTKCENKGIPNEEKLRFKKET